jgi:uncharacterized protein
MARTYAIVSIDAIEAERLIMPEWIYVIRAAREGFAAGPTEEEQQIMSDHFGYLKGLLDDGQLILAGPALDAAFGIAVFEADDEAAALEIMESDPSVAQGVMNATLHPYRSSLLRGRDR